MRRSFLKTMCGGNVCQSPMVGLTGMVLFEPPYTTEKCCKTPIATCADYPCVLPAEKKSPEGTCTNSDCELDDCCRMKAGTCQANYASVACTGATTFGNWETMGSDAAACCVADTKCSAYSRPSSGTISRAAGTDIAGSVLLLLLAIAAA